MFKEWEALGCVETYDTATFFKQTSPVSHVNTHPRHDVDPLWPFSFPKPFGRDEGY